MDPQSHPVPNFLDFMCQENKFIQKNHLETVATANHTLTHFLSWRKTCHRESVAAQNVCSNCCTLAKKTYLGSRVTLSKVIVVCVMFCTCKVNELILKVFRIWHVDLCRRMQL